MFNKIKFHELLCLYVSIGKAFFTSALDQNEWL